MTNQADGVKTPKRSFLKKKHDEIKALRERPMTSVRAPKFIDIIELNLPYRLKLIAELTHANLKNHHLIELACSKSINL